jgi:uncharacterized protein (DUF885 family)
MRAVIPALILGLFCLSASAQAPPGPAKPPAAWIARSNQYTSRLLAVQLEHSPESASHEGLVKYDERISDPRLADDLAQRHELETVLAKVKQEAGQEKDEHVRQDLEILRKSFDLQFRQQDFALAHKVGYINASAAVFQGLRTLLDDQVEAGRRPAALVRLRKYAGLEPGFQPFSELLQQRELAQMGKAGVIYPAKDEVETDLARNSNYVKGIAVLFQKYQLKGWEESYAKLSQELVAYDAWVRASILPKARADFRLQPEEYALAFEGYGIDLPPAEIAKRAHAAFRQYQAEMAPLAERIAKARGLPSGDYREVLRALKKQQITGDAILPFYERRLHEIEDIVRRQHLVSLPARPAIIRLATAAETVQQPAPHMDAPAFLNNTGQRGEFVLPLNIPAADGTAQDVYDDFTFDAVSWTMTAHEARPGHELQFDSMLEHGVSLARVLYAFNSTNVEGWGLYSEYIMQPFEPAEGQLCTLQLRLLRAARAFLDPELQAGTVTPEQAYAVLEKDVGASHAFAKEEVERFTFRSPGQANSYFYGYMRLLELRQETEKALGRKFNQQKYHDFILEQGLLPPDLMRKVVLEDFVPAQR